MIRIVSQHTWQLALLEIRKQKSLVASLQATLAGREDAYRHLEERLGDAERERDAALFALEEYRQIAMERSR